MIEAAVGSKSSVESSTSTPRSSRWPPTIRTWPLRSKTALCPVRATFRSGPALTALGVTRTVVSMGLPVTSTPPATKISPVGKRIAVWLARASARGCMD